MESRKMVLMNLFARKEWRQRHGEQTFGHESWWSWVSSNDIYTLPCVK